MLKERRGMDDLYTFVFYQYLYAYKMESGLGERGMGDRKASEECAGVFLAGGEVSLNQTGIE